MRLVDSREAGPYSLRAPLKGAQEYITMKRILYLVQALSIAKGYGSGHGVSRALKTYLSRMDDCIKHEGKKSTAKFYKDLHYVATRIALGMEFQTIPFRKTNKYGAPRELNPVMDLLLGDNESKRFGLTITRSYERIRIRPEWDPHPITDEGPELPHGLLDGFSTFAKEWLGRRGFPMDPVTICEDPLSDVWGLAQKKGPNGPSIITAHIDAKAIEKDGLYESITSLCVATGLYHLRDILSNFKEHIPEPEGTKVPVTGRIALIPEGGAKTRTIAIGDYWSQRVLTPIHDKVMELLRTLETDGTWAQDDQFARVCKLSPGNPTYSFDLSSATDRFPVSLQTVVVSHLFGKEVGDLWEKVLCHRDFHSPTGNVRWRRGQPLGLLSSWAVFALTHHLFIEYSAFLEGRKTFKGYAVLGDDVVIWNRKVASRYKSLLEQIDVKINQSKSLVSEGPTPQVEFAKRIALNGVEISGCSWKVLTQGAKSISGFVNLVNELNRRSWDLSWAVLDVPACFSSERSRALLKLWACYKEGIDAPLSRVTPKPTSITNCLAPLTRLTSPIVRTVPDPLTDPKLLQERIKHWVLETRRERLKSFEARMHGMPADKILAYLHKQGWSGTIQTVGLDGLHPLLFVQFKLIEQIAQMGAVMDQVDDILEVLQYVPSTTMDAYYEDRKVSRTKFLLSMTQRAWETLSDREPQLAKESGYQPPRERKR
jgi:hypothetical protein